MLKPNFVAGVCVKTWRLSEGKCAKPSFDIAAYITSLAQKILKELK